MLNLMVYKWPLGCKVARSLFMLICWTRGARIVNCFETVNGRTCILFEEIFRSARFGCGCTVPGVSSPLCCWYSLLRYVDVGVSFRSHCGAAGQVAGSPSPIPRHVFIFWIMAPCSLVAWLQTFGAPFILKLQYRSTRLRGVLAAWCSFDTRIVFK